MNVPEFLNRSMFILGEEGYVKVSTPVVSIAGLGGVGGLVFLTLVRSGVKRFRLTDGGAFDPPDMNRQILAFNHTLGLDKHDVYVKAGLDINPDLEIEQYPNGLTLDNIDKFIKGSDIFIRAMDWQKDFHVKRKSIELVGEYKIPMFQAFTTGVASVLHNYEPGGMTPQEFWPLFKNPKVMKYLHTDGVAKKLVECQEENILPSISIGANMASLLLASEVLVYMLQGTSLIDRPPIYTPKFVVLNPFNMTMNLLDGNNI